MDHFASFARRRLRHRRHRVLRALRRDARRDRPGARTRPEDADRYDELARQRARRLADRIRRRRRCADAATRRPTTCARSRSIWSPTTCATETAARLVELDPRRGHPPRHRLPRHAVPAAGARRHRPPRRRLRAAAPGHPSVVAGDDRPRRHHDLGGLGRGRRRRRRRTARSTTTARARSSSFLHQLRRRHPGPRRRPGLPALPRSRRSRAAASPGRRRCTSRRTGASSRRGGPVRPAPR